MRKGDMEEVYVAVPFVSQHAAYLRLERKGAYRGAPRHVRRASILDGASALFLSISPSRGRPEPGVESRLDSQAGHAWGARSQTSFARVTREALSRLPHWLGKRRRLEAQMG